jgi:methionyl-tRNA formyltransferase
MGSPKFSVPSLEQLLLSRHKVVAVYTQPDRPAGRGRSLAISPVKEAALKWRLSVMQPESLRTTEELKKLAAFKPDVVVVCAYGHILTQALLDIPPRQCINVHFSLLPKHRGASPVAAAILAGDEFTGVTIQLVRLKVDTGPVLAAASIPISNHDNTETLMEKLSIIGAHLLEEALTGWLDGTIKPQNQDESKATYFGQVKKEDGEIDWRLPALDIWRRVRAYYPWPGCFTYWKGKQLKFNETEVMTERENNDPGRVTVVGEEIGVVTGEGTLIVKNIQYAGKKAMSAADFIRGQRDFIGTKLPS